MEQGSSFDPFVVLDPFSILSPLILGCRTLASAVSITQSSRLPHCQLSLVTGSHRYVSSVPCLFLILRSTMLHSDGSAYVASTALLRVLPGIRMAMFFRTWRWVNSQLLALLTIPGRFS